MKSSEGEGEGEGGVAGETGPFTASVIQRACMCSQSAGVRWTESVHLNAESWEGCRRSPFKPGPVNCSSTPLCNVGKQTHVFQKQGND